MEHIDGIGQACGVDHAVCARVVPHSKFLDAFANAVPALLGEHVMNLYEPVRASMQNYCEVLVTEITRLNDQLDSLLETARP